jgi:hypothetical protein
VRQAVDGILRMCCGSLNIAGDEFLVMPRT